MTAPIHTAGQRRPLIALPKCHDRRVSSDSAWPIRRADGSTPAQTRATYRPLVDARPMQEPRPWWKRLVRP